MDVYVLDIKIAILFFPLIINLCITPYVIYQYHKYGSILFIRSLVLCSVLFYLLAVYCLVIFPLPDINDVSSFLQEKEQLVPFHFVLDMFSHIGKNTSLVSQITAFFLNRDALLTIFNCLMFIPFGVYARYYFNLSFKKTILLSFIFSLFLELTQRSGLYFIYPQPYRLFDVDDLIINTFGGSLGFLMAPWITALLPSKRDMDVKAKERAERISFFRRGVALLIDLSIVDIVGELLFRKEFGYLVDYNVVFMLYGFLSMYISKGYTIGKFVVKMKVKNTQGDTTMLWQYAIRSILLYGLCMNLFQYLLLSLEQYVNTLDWIYLALCGVCGLIILYLLIELILVFFRKKKFIFYEKLSKTKNISVA